MEIPTDGLKNEVNKESDAVKLLLMLCYVNVNDDQEEESEQESDLEKKC